MSTPATTAVEPTQRRPSCRPRTEASSSSIFDMGRTEYMRRYMRQRRANAREVRVEGEQTLWKCKGCGEWFPVNDFPPKGRGRLYTCKSCSGRNVEVEEYEEKQELEAFLRSDEKA